jgi:hypothetical protein
MVYHFESDSPEVMTALVVVLPLIVVVEINCCSLSGFATPGARAVGGAPTPGDQRSGRPPNRRRTFRQPGRGGGASGLVSVFLRSSAHLLECRLV